MKGVRELVAVEPAIGVPLDPGEVVGVGPDEAPLAAVGEERELGGRAAATEVLDDVGDGLPALADADARVWVVNSGRVSPEAISHIRCGLRRVPSSRVSASGSLTAEPLRQPTTRPQPSSSTDIEEGAQGLTAGLVWIEGDQSAARRRSARR
jgi:hypothetical protein